MLPPRQTTYGQGNDGVYSPTQYESWGPAFDGSMRDFGLPLPDGTRPQIRYAAPSHDVRKDLFNTGVNSQNDISLLEAVKTVPIFSPHSMSPRRALSLKTPTTV